MEEYEKTIQSQRFVKVAFHKTNCITTQRKRFHRRESLVLVAAHILGKSKASLLEKYYYVLKPAFMCKPTLLTPKPDLRLCYIDTNCLVITITSHIIDYIRIMRSSGVAEHFDFSNLPKTHQLYSKERESTKLEF